MDNFTDLATEFGQNLMEIGEAVRDVEIISGIEITRMDLTSKRLAEKLGRRSGLYYTLEPIDKDADIATQIADVIKAYDIDWTKVLVIGLGNPTFEADALGSHVIDGLQVVAGSLMTFMPMTSAKTGIESNNLIQAVVAKVKPTAIIAIDSLATMTPKRIGQCYQITSAGLVPGSGVGNDRKLLDKESLGVDVLAIGVPFVCNMLRWASKDTLMPNMVVTPSHIDTLVLKVAQNISKGIILALI